MFRASKLFLFGLLFCFAAGAQAQDLQILFPQQGQQVRGEITVRYTGVPDGGYVVVKLDNSFHTATSQGTFLLNTFPPTISSDGTHTLTITSINAGGGRVDEKTVSFEVANSRIDTGAEGVRLQHWQKWMRLDPDVQRYRVFAESNAIIDNNTIVAGGGEYISPRIAAPLDWQVSALLRRIVRDVDMYSDDPEGLSSANIRTVVQRAHHRQREEETGGEIDAPRARVVSRTPVKRPWSQDWEPARETGEHFVKMIEPSGKEYNATRKPRTIALADLLPTFPESEVRPGSTWSTNMTFLSDLSSREPLNVNVPITFTAFENIQTPAGANRRAAKLESRFQIPEETAKRMAVNLVLAAELEHTEEEEEGEEGEEGETAGAEAEGAGADENAPVYRTWKDLPPGELQFIMEGVTAIRTTASRVLWFDVENFRVLRSEDDIRTSFSYLPEDDPPVEVSYHLAVTTWYDDTTPPATDSYTGGAGTAHARDNVTDPTIDKMVEQVP